MHSRIPESFSNPKDFRFYQSDSENDDLFNSEDDQIDDYSDDDQIYDTDEDEEQEARRERRRRTRTWIPYYSDEDQVYISDVDQLYDSDEERRRTFSRSWIPFHDSDIDEEQEVNAEMDNNPQNVEGDVEQDVEANKENDAEQEHKQLRQLLKWWLNKENENQKALTYQSMAATEEVDCHTNYLNVVKKILRFSFQFVSKIFKLT